MFRERSVSAAASGLISDETEEARVRRQLGIPGDEEEVSVRNWDDVLAPLMLDPRSSHPHWEARLLA